jgi:hypothetical protein
VIKIEFKTSKPFKVVKNKGREKTIFQRQQYKCKKE